MKKPFQRSNGVFYGILMVKRKPVWRSLETRNEAEAIQRFEVLRQELIPHRKHRLSEYAESFLERKSLEYSPKTLQMYRHCFKNFIRLTGDHQLQNVRPIDAEQFKIARAKEVKPVSVNIDLKHLKAAFRDAVRLRFIDESPFENVRPMRMDSSEAAFLTEAEFRRLLAGIRDDDFKGLLTTTVLTAMRLGEVTNLRWENVDFERQVIRIKSHGDFRVKCGRPRSIPMNEWVREYLKTKKKSTDYVFSQPNGKRLTGAAVSKRFKRCVQKADLSNEIHFHSLRHTGISWMLQHGVPLSATQRIAGHSSIGMTQHYTHYEDENLLSAINLLNPGLS